MDDPSTRSEAVIRLESLAPKYTDAAHGIYAEILRHTLAERPEVRNIALAGAYGVGKSSVLRNIVDTFDDRAITLSLLTLGSKPSKTAPPKDANPAAQTTSNRIQREIVKQLLYRQTPRQAPDSRFRRIVQFHLKRETALAATVGVLVLLFLIALGADVSALAAGSPPLLTVPPWVRTLAAYLAVATVAALLVLLVRMLTHGRLGIERLTAGPATVTLSVHSASYFDEYLDEIIYSFEVNPDRDIVILEDLDRFDDIGIFESLRSLNTLLNSAPQLSRRSIRFIYAVRDSVFENIGRDKTSAEDDQARAELERANRTKFFDLIVPVVPFVTHKNARDLVHELLNERGHALSKDLVDLVARHVADMRLIQNIVNEYEVFKHQLLDAATPVPELRPNYLFAMVVFKNVHITDFENIRHGTSSLDNLYESWRSLVSTNLHRIRGEEARLNSRVEAHEAAEDRSRELAARLREVVHTLSEAPGSGLINGEMYNDDGTLDDATLTTPDFWRALVESDGQIGLRVNSDTTNRFGKVDARTMELSVDALEVLLGTSLDVEAWADDSCTQDRAAMRQCLVDSEFLRRHTWQELVEHPQYTHDERTFRQWVEDLLPSHLAVELVSGGWITSYFTLHVSAFYGTMIRKDAMAYILRNIDRNAADADYQLEAEDVEAILRDQGKSVLGERSMYNVSILDHLLAASPEDASTIVNRLAGAGTDERAFIDQYMSTGSAKDLLVAQLTPLWPSMFTYIVEHAPLERNKKVELLDVAMGHQSDTLDYELNESVRAFLEHNYRALPSLTEPTQPPFSPIQTVSVLDRTGTTLPEVAGLSQEARAALSTTRAYRITAENLAHLVGSDRISLDALRDASGDVYAYAIDSITEYLQASSTPDGSRFTIESPSAFIGVLNASDTWESPVFDALVRGAHPSCQVKQLSEVPPAAWPALVHSRRTPATFENVADYVEEHGFDSPLAALLSDADMITEVDGADEARRVDVAMAIVNSGDLMRDTDKVRLTHSLRPGVLPTASVEPRRGPLIGLLVSAGLISDDEEAFSERLMIDWRTQEAAIAASGDYADMVGPETLRPAYVAPLMRSRTVDPAVQEALVDQLSEFTELPQDAYNAVAECALESRIHLTAAAIEGLQVGGADPDNVLRLLARVDDHVSTDELRQILRRLGQPYSIIADKGTQRPLLPDTPANRAILERLKSAGIVASYRAQKRARVRAFLSRV